MTLKKYENFTYSHNEFSPYRTAVEGMIKFFDIFELITPAQYQYFSQFKSKILFLRSSRFLPPSDSSCPDLRLCRELQQNYQPTKKNIAKMFLQQF